jgi:hypothetical protein
VDVDDADVDEQFGFVSEEIDPLACDGTDPEMTILSADLEENPGWSSTTFRNKNNHSLVIRVDFGQSAFLFTGDLQEPAIETMVDFYRDSPLLDVDVYQVGHHGSHNATTWSLIEAIDDPLIAVLSMGRCTRTSGLFNAFNFGHPRADIIRMLQAGIQRRRSTSKRVPVAVGVRDFRQIRMRDAVYATGWDGTVVVRATSAGQYRVTVAQQAEPESCT